MRLESGPEKNPYFKVAKGGCKRNIVNICQTMWKRSMKRLKVQLQSFYIRISVSNSKFSSKYSQNIFFHSKLIKMLKIWRKINTDKSWKTFAKTGFVKALLTFFGQIFLCVIFSFVNFPFIYTFCYLLPVFHSLNFL